MEGKGFKTLVKENDKVTEGQQLVTFDRAAIKAAGYPDVVVLLLTNSDDYKKFKIATPAEIEKSAVKPDPESLSSDEV